jgi:hypothetical protein
MMSTMMVPAMIVAVRAMMGVRDDDASGAQQGNPGQQNCGNHSVDLHIRDDSFLARVRVTGALRIPTVPVG